VALSVTPAVNANQIVNVLPSVINAGGNALVLSGMMLTASPRPPIGALLSFPTAATVSAYFGATSQEAALASIYFLGYQNSPQKPGNLFYWQYPWQQPVQAWTRGGSIAGLSLAQLQSLTGQLTITINGAVNTASIALSGATSFGNAAQVINSSLAISGINQGAYIGSIAGTTLSIGTVTNGPQLASFIGSIAGGTLTVTTLNSGNISSGLLLVGTGVTVGTTVSALLSGVGGVGTYSVSVNQTALSENVTAYQNSGAIAIGDQIAGTGISGTLFIASFLTGTAGVGTYQLSGTATVANGSITVALPGVTYDTISGGLQIWSSTTGSGSTIGYASGALATALNLTQATGAVLSQGSAQATPSTAMNAIIAINQNWASFMTLFEPVDTDKVLFALWNNGQQDEYHYACWNTSVVNLAVGGPQQAVANITSANYSGTSLIQEIPAAEVYGGTIAAFLMGYGASIDYNAFQGRATAAFKSQSGIAPQIFSTAQYTQLLSYGMNCMGDFTTANQAFTFYSNGTVTGPFLWLDSYLDQIWMRNQFQLAGMALLTQVNSVPYNQYGYGLIQNGVLEPVAQQGLFNGVIQPGIPLSLAEQAEIFAITGDVRVAPIVQSRGWYAQIVPATAQVRQARTSPTINFLWSDGESIQTLVINDILVT
jgi:hypothetical protein